MDVISDKQSVFSSKRFRSPAKKAETLLDHHKAFFHVDDLEVRRRSKSKLDLPTFMRSVS